MAEAVQPTGTVTFLFSDVEDHTRLWELFPDEMPISLERHDAILRGAIERHEGYVFSTAGDAFSAAFSSAESASNAAVEAQEELHSEDWRGGCELRVRMGLHSGGAHERDGDYFGPEVIRAARLMALGHGGQVLVSAATAALLREWTELASMLRPLGEVRLRGLGRAEQVSELRYPGLEEEFLPLVNEKPESGRLPHVAGDLIGRDEALAAVLDLVSSSSLVTLTGPGGVGKTRLAIEIGSLEADRFGDGVWFVPLASVMDDSAVPNAVADVLGVQETAGRSLTESIVGAIAGRDLLLILDNCEHVVDGARRFTQAIANGCTTVVVFATSREPLSIVGECVLPVSPLSVASDPGSLFAPAVELFVARASAADPAFVVDDLAIATIEAICGRLDGMPLAIELAAARARGLGLDGLEDHLDDRFRLLRSRGEADPRHKTLRATVSWSYDLLDDWLRELFCRAGVFAGGFSLEAAENVLAFGGRSSLDVADGLADLVDKSMVRVLDAGVTRRYRMLETMRQFGADEIDDASRVETARRFIEYYVVFAQDADAAMWGPGVGGALARIRSDYENLREAYRLAIEIDSPDEVALLVVSLHDFASAAVVGESDAWAEDLSDRLTSGHPLYPDVLATALHGARARGDRVKATDLIARLERGAASGEFELTPFAKESLGVAYWFRRDTERGLALQQSALDAARAAGDSRSQNFILATMSMAQDSFDHALAKRSAEEALEIGRSADSPIHICLGLLPLAGVVIHDDPRRAYELAGETVEIARNSEMTWQVATGVRLQARALSRLGNLELASATFAEALDLNGVGDYGELLWYTVINTIEHLWLIGDTEAAAIALGALDAAPAAPSDDLVARAISRFRERLATELRDDEEAIEASGASMHLAELLRYLRDRLTAHAETGTTPSVLPGD